MNRPGAATGRWDAAVTVTAALGAAAALNVAFPAGAVVSGISVAASGIVPGIAGWSVARRRPRLITPADRVTLVRVVLIGVLTAAVVLVFAGAMPARTWTVLVIAACAAVLDAADGWVARRSNGGSGAGARLDAEADAAALLVLSALLAFTVGWWVLLIGLLRYAFALGTRLRRAWRQQLPYSGARRVVAGVQAAVVVVGLGPVVPVPLAAGSAAVALAVLLWSFGRDVVWLEQTQDWRQDP
ncbi:CDP-alcohol phosphatidyltransferase family protein [Nesterenkonia sphaerica]|uniref:CDP-alcohol phosphatidyltransferase family protein n=1 Tax=Nesterenkonia sphaerica TaxID=1804988 RepID=A0A5R9A8I7_9MICC|nr:CDP-alcohol phosphatidyltransferase family protein [Nesterenkonia sphaerica]TLP74217.1 CDP-alcohol phosphatidyltransferase family protein [Nesterenkonia sphaerica]